MLELEQMIKKLKETSDIKTYSHCIRTMEEAKILAQHYNENEEKAKIAGLLHDCGKKRDMDDNLTHAKSSWEVAKKIYCIDDIDILNAILYHTTGRENMTMLEKIVYIADKIEVNRNFPGVEELRALAYCNINNAIIKSLEGTIKFVRQKNLNVDNKSLKTLDYLMKEGDNS